MNFITNFFKRIFGFCKKNKKVVAVASISIPLAIAWWWFSRKKKD
jgi:hypothetical protein